MTTCYCTGACRKTGACPLLGPLAQPLPSHRDRVTRTIPVEVAPAPLTEERVRQIAREEAQQVLRESCQRVARGLPERTRT